MQQSYPVLIEVTEYRLVWVEADSAEEAESFVSDDSEYIGTVEPYEADWAAKAPKDRWDWQDLYSPIGPAPMIDAHVRTHQQEMSRRAREAKRQACESEGHPGAETFDKTTGTWCPRCGYLPLATAKGEAR